jgi:hypothetical protein
MKKLLLVAFLRLFLLFLPMAILTFYFCYLADVYLQASGLRNFMFLPAVASLAVLFLVFNIVIGPVLKKIRDLKRTASH